MNEHSSDRFQRRMDRVHNTKGRILSGVLIIVAGLVLLLKELGYMLPACLFTWKMLLVVIGLYTGFKHGFKRPGWLILIFVGFVFMLEDIFPGTHINQFLWPILIIGAGVFIISTAGKRKQRWKEWQERCHYDMNKFNTEPSPDMLETVSIMGGVKKNVITKNFKGGEVTCVMGGAEINLSQADFEGQVVLEITQVFGGTLLIVPSNWEIQSENIAILGGIEDKRKNIEAVQPSGKVLILRGITVFGGIDIKSY